LIVLKGSKTLGGLGEGFGIKILPPSKVVVITALVPPAPSSANVGFVPVPVIMVGFKDFIARLGTRVVA